jgi:hypothetical protein
LENFYNKIKNKISNTPDVPTDWGMWNDIESSLEKKKRNRFLPILLVLPFIVFFSGLFGYLLAPNQGAVISNNIEEVRDTIYITNTISAVDTVLKTEFVTRWRYHNPSQHLQLQRQVQDLATNNQSLQNNIDVLDSKLNDYQYAFSESILKENPKYRHLDIFENGTKRNNRINSDAPISERYPIGVLAYSPLLSPKSLFYTRPQIMIVSDLWFENMVINKEPESFLDKIVPDYVNVGVSVETPSLAFTKNLSPGLEVGLGLNTEFMFSPRVSLVTGIRTRSSQNQTSDQIIASTYPQPMFGSEDSFKNLKVKSSFLDIPFTFKYNMFKQEANKLYLTGGVLVSKHNQTEYVYEYVRNTSEVYYEEKIKGTGWNLGSATLGVGYEMETWGNTSAFVESNLRYQFKSETEAIHGIGFRFGMYYKI